jgi:hypothetical protein
VNEPEFHISATQIAARNLTANIAAVTAGFDYGHLGVTYFCTSEPTIGDEQERETTVAELIAAFPQIKTADAEIKLFSADFTPPKGERVVFQRVV